MQNFMGYYPPDNQGNLYLPWGNGAVSFIDALDVGRAAAVTLAESGHEGRAYTLTGPAAFGIEEAAATMSRASGRKITYVDVPEPTAKSAMLGAGMPEWMTDAMMDLHAIDKAGYAAAVTADVAELTGRPGRSFEEFVAENAASRK